MVAGDPDLVILGKAPGSMAGAAARIGTAKEARGKRVNRRRSEQQKPKYNAPDEGASASSTPARSYTRKRNSLPRSFTPTSRGIWAYDLARHVSPPSTPPQLGIHGPNAPDVPDDEDEVEARQDRRHQVDVLRRALQVVVPPVDGVGGRQHRSTTGEIFSVTDGRGAGTRADSSGPA